MFLLWLSSFGLWLATSVVADVCVNPDQVLLDVLNQSSGASASSAEGMMMNGMAGMDGGIGEGTPGGAGVYNSADGTYNAEDTYNNMYDNSAADGGAFNDVYVSAQDTKPGRHRMNANGSGESGAYASASYSGDESGELEGGFDSNPSDDGEYTATYDGGAYGGFYDDFDTYGDYNDDDASFSEAIAFQFYATCDANDVNANANDATQPQTGKATNPLDPVFDKVEGGLDQIVDHLGLLRSTIDSFVAHGASLPSSDPSSANLALLINSFATFTAVKVEGLDAILQEFVGLYNGSTGIGNNASITAITGCARMSSLYEAAIQSLCGSRDNKSLANIQTALAKFFEIVFAVAILMLLIDWLKQLIRTPEEMAMLAGADPSEHGDGYQTYRRSTYEQTAAFRLSHFGGGDTDVDSRNSSGSVAGSGSDGDPGVGGDRGRGRGGGGGGGGEAVPRSFVTNPEHRYSSASLYSEAADHYLNEGQAQAQGTATTAFVGSPPPPPY
jgi:hypothetical protein